MVKYLKRISNKGLIHRPDTEKSLECFVDTDFCGNCNKLTSSKDTSTAKSRRGYVIRFAGCPIVWGSKLQTKIALSITKAVYVALSKVMRKVISIINIIQESREQKSIEADSKADFHCKVFEDNYGALELAKTPKMRTRTKHINVIHHWFLEHVWSKTIKIYPISTQHQKADIFTKSSIYIYIYLPIVVSIEV